MNASISTIEEALVEINISLPVNACTHITNKYHPELNKIPEINYHKTRFFQEIIDILQFVVELGRVIILLEVPKISSFMINPCIGYIHASLSLFEFF